MNTRFLVVLISIVFFEGCSPFGNSSLIEKTQDLISDIFDLKITQEFNSGGSQNLISNPTSGLPEDNHQLTLSVGNTFQQSSYVTAQGHTVEVVISGVRK